MSKMLLGAALALSLIFALGWGDSASAQTSASARSVGELKMEINSPKILIAYFSHSGNTRTVAGQIQSLVGGDLFEIITAVPYPAEYNPTTVQAKAELENKHRPALTARVDNMNEYEVVFLGYPNWWGTMPMALFSFLEQYDFSGKTIIPFCTHEGSRFGRSVDDLTQVVPGAKLLKGFEIRGSRVDSARPEIIKWTQSLGFQAN